MLSKQVVCLKDITRSSKAYHVSIRYFDKFNICIGVLSVPMYEIKTNINGICVKNPYNYKDVTIKIAIKDVNNNTLGESDCLQSKKIILVNTTRKDYKELKTSKIQSNIRCITKIVCSTACILNSIAYIKGEK